MRSLFPLILFVALPWTVLAGDSGFVGSAVCGECHQDALVAWRGSHHDLAMAEATPETVLGDFDDAEVQAQGVTSRFYRGPDGAYLVRTDGPDGELHEYRVRYTFGWTPLQQYLIELPNGRIQSLGLAWDSRPREEGGQVWFHLYPNERVDHAHPLHWTGREQNWNYQCAECHSTNLRKNYDPDTDGYRTAFDEINVACEACHGSGAKHVEWARSLPAGETAGGLLEKGGDMGLVVDLSDRDGGHWSFDPESGLPKRSVPRTSHTEIELCARCHSRRGQIWEDYEPGKPLLDTHRLSLLEERLYFADGQIRDEVYVYGSFLQSSMYAAGVTCSDCHEPHSLKLRAEGNAVCARCHLSTRYDTPEHHHHEADTQGSACVSCHMPERIYMVNDPRADHSMRVPRPDLTVSIGTPNACTGCHQDQPPAWAAQAVESWYPESKHRGPHFGEVLHLARTRAPGADAALMALAGDAKQPGIARATALDHLADAPRAEHLELVGRLATDPDPLIRAEAAGYLESLDLRSRVELGWPLLDDPVRSVRLNAALALAPLLNQRLPDQYREQLAARIQEFETAQRVTAERPETQLNLGLMAVAQGRTREAEAAYRKALELDPVFVPASVNLADLYRQMGSDEEGEGMLEEAIRLSPEEPALHHSLGLLQVRRQQLDEALKSLGRAAELAPEHGRSDLPAWK